MEITKIAGQFTGAAGKLDTVVKAAKGLLCLPSILKSFSFTSPANIIKGLGGIAAGMAAGIVNSIADAIQDRVNDILGLATIPLKLLQSYVKSLLNTVDNIQQIYKNVEQKAKDLLDFNKNTQNCAVQAANFMNCITTALTKKITKKILSKVSGSINKLNSQFDKIQKEIQAESFKAGGYLEQHVGRQVQAAEKLTKQLSILTR